MADRIRGGYIMLARKVLESDIWHWPPWQFKVWLYLLLKANHDAGHGKLDRGQCLVRLEDLAHAAAWYRGFAREQPSKSQVSRFLRRLRDNNAIATTKTTRGTIITICNYGRYQEAKSYGRNDDGAANATAPLHDRQELDKNHKGFRDPHMGPPL